MLSRRLWIVVLTVAVHLGLAGLCMAANPPYIQATSDRLAVEGWVLVMPQVSVDKKTNKTWVRYDHPDGSHQSYTVGPGEKITPKWAKKGARGYQETPPGYSIESTRKIKDWWARGGRGTYVIKNGKMVPVVPKKPTDTKPPKDDCDGKAPSNNPFDPCAKIKPAQTK